MCVYYNLSLCGGRYYLFLIFINMSKVCKICNIEKDELLFNFTSSDKKYLRGFCIDCEKEKNRLRRLTHKYKRDYRTKEQKIDRLNLWRLNNPDKVKESIKKWTENNPDKVKESKLKYKQSIKSKISESVRRRIKKYITVNRINKNNKTFDIVGCSPQDLILHLEKQFKEGMSWDNYGLYGWHIDHKIPLSSASTEEDLFKLCHYTNLQPLWAIDNLKKGSSF